MTVMPAEGLFSLMWLLIALPLAGAAILLFTGRRSNSWGPYWECSPWWHPPSLGVLLLIDMMGLPTEERTVRQVATSGCSLATSALTFAFQLDQLSMVFIL